MAKAEQDGEGDTTTVSPATSKSKSLRATIPIGVARQFHLSEGDKLNWQIRVVDGELGIIVKPLKGRK
jgi:bifunctional DNA-binding transcriptional regulator/antitoxin component of YhaV-PrlF toxin-antitoxin module